MCPFAVAAGGNCTVLNRNSPGARARLAAIEARRGYYIHPYDAEPEFIPVAAALTYDQADFGTIAAYPGELLLTTALKREGIMESLGVIRQLLEEREGRPTVVIAAENQVDTLFLKNELVSAGFQPQEEILFVRAVVDRICNKPEIEEDGLVVQCEGFARIYLERTKPAIEWAFPQCLRGLKKQPLCEMSNDFEFVVDRKKWVINAAHLLMALTAHYYRFPSVRAFASQEFGRRLLEKSVNEFERLMRYHYQHDDLAYPRTGLVEFTRSVRERIATFPQRYPDIVTRFDGPEKLPLFFEDFHRKITQLALEDMHRSIHAPYFASLVTHIVVELVKEGRWIRDASPGSG
jgi:hypothetical protein